MQDLVTALGKAAVEMDETENTDGGVEDDESLVATLKAVDFDAGCAAVAHEQ